MAFPLTWVVKANDPMQATSKTYGSIGQARSLLLAKVHLVPQFRMTNSPPTAWHEAVFKCQLSPATPRGRFEDFSRRNLHDKWLGLPRWTQLQELNNISFDTDFTTVSKHQLIDAHPEVDTKRR